MLEQENISNTTIQILHLNFKKMLNYLKRLNMFLILIKFIETTYI